MFSRWLSRRVASRSKALLPSAPRHRPRLEPLEARRLCAFVVTGADAGGGPQVNVFDLAGNLRFSFFAYDPAFRGGVRVAVADINRDGISDIITAPGPGGSPDIRIFNGQGLQFAGPSSDIMTEFLAYDAFFTGGVYVAAGDVSGNGVADIITGAGAGGGPHVKVFNPVTLSVIDSFYAYDQRFQGGVRVASGFVNQDRFEDVITGAGPGGGPHVKVFDGFSGAVIGSFMAYATSFSGGVFVGSGDVNHDGFWDIITGPGSPGGPFVQVFSGFNGSVLRSFNAYASSFAGGVTVASFDVNADGFSDIITAPGPGGGPQLKIFSGASSNALLQTYLAYSSAWTGGVFVGAG
jgi:hypothetical protein